MRMFRVSYVQRDNGDGFSGFIWRTVNEDELEELRDSKYVKAITIIKRCRNQIT